MSFMTMRYDSFYRLSKLLNKGVIANPVEIIEDIKDIESAVYLFDRKTKDEYQEEIEKWFHV